MIPRYSMFKRPDFTQKMATDFLNDMIKLMSTLENPTSCRFIFNSAKPEAKEYQEKNTGLVANEIAALARKMPAEKIQKYVDGIHKNLELSASAIIFDMSRDTDTSYILSTVAMTFRVWEKISNPESKAIFLDTMGRHLFYKASHWAEPSHSWLTACVNEKLSSEGKKISDTIDTGMKIAGAGMALGTAIFFACAVLSGKKLQKEDILIPLKP